MSKIATISALSASIFSACSGKDFVPNVSGNGAVHSGCLPFQHKNRHGQAVPSSSDLLNVHVTKNDGLLEHI